MANRESLKSEKRKGSGTVEFAVVAPLLLLMLFGATDFARMFYHGVTVANAAGIGSFWGSQSNIKAANFTAIQFVATSDASDLENVSASPELYCDCPGGTEVDCITGTCVDYGSPRVYSKTRVQQTFDTIVPWPLIPKSVRVTRDAYIRVQ